MSIRRSLAAAALAALVLPAGAAVAGPAGTDGHESQKGLCVAWSNNDNGRAHGNAENAGPFVALQAAADAARAASVEEYCAGL
jgi:hypothetical protein